MYLHNTPENQREAILQNITAEHQRAPDNNQPMPTRSQATAIGLLAVVLWSAIVGLIRAVGENFGPVGGAALIYSVAALILCLTVGRGNLRAMPPRYVLCGGVFVCRV